MCSGTKGLKREKLNSRRRGQSPVRTPSKTEVHHIMRASDLKPIKVGKESHLTSDHMVLRKKVARAELRKRGIPSRERGPISLLN